MRDDAPFISIVVPVFNGSKTIAPCIDSLLTLDYPVEQFEIIIVNNASTDNTAEILSGYGDRIRTFLEAKKGPAAARNRGISEAAGEVIAMTDADCLADGNWLRNLVQPLLDGSVGIVGGKILSRRPCNGIEKFGETIHDHRRAIEVFNPPYVITMNWSSPRKILIESGLFDERFIRCEDVDLSQRIHKQGHRIKYQEDAIVFHNNERSLAGLFREGYQHGVWAVKHNKHNREINISHGHRRINLHSYREIGCNLVAAVFSARRLNALCQATFDMGKKFGKAAGSIKFGYLDL